MGLLVVLFGKNKALRRKTELWKLNFLEGGKQGEGTNTGNCSGKRNSF